MENIWSQGEENRQLFHHNFKKIVLTNTLCGNFKDGATADLETANSKQNEKKELDEVSGIKKLIKENLSDHRDYPLSGNHE